MKRRFSLICSLLVLVIGCAMIFVGCGSGEEIGQNTDEYKFYYNNVTTLLNDGITVDGKLDDAAYENAEWFESDRCGVPIRMTTVYGANGLYVAVDADVNGVYYINDANVSYNSYIEVNIGANCDKASFEEVTDYACLQATAKYAVSTLPFKFYAKAFVKGGALNTKESTGMSAEFYIPWTELGVSEAPEEVGIFPFYVRTYNNNANAVSSETLRYARTRTPHLFFRFGEGGYAFNDADDAKIGDSSSGVAKTPGWDLSDESNGIVSTKGGDNQWIFVTEAEETDNYSIEATVSARGGINDNSPQAGILVGNNELDEMIAVNFSCSNTNISDKRIILKELNYSSGYFMSGYRWTTTQLYDSGKKFSHDISTGVTLKAYKIGKRMLVYVDGVLVADKELSEFEYNAVPGLYSIAADATWKDIKYTAYDDYAAAIGAAASEAGTNLVYVNAESGRNVKADKTSVKKGESVKFTVVTSGGKEVDKVFINDTDVTETVKAAMVDGVYAFTPSKNSGVIDFKVTYKEVAASGYLIFGKLLPDASLGTQFDSAPKIVILDKNNALTRYETTASTNGTYMISLQAGEYTLIITAPTHYQKRVDVTVSAGTASFDDISLESSRGIEVNGTVTVQGKSVKGNQSYSYGDHTIYNTEANTLSYTFVPNSASTKCMISAELNLLTNPNDNDPSMGFMFSADSDAGNKGFFVVFIRNGYRYGTPYVTRKTVENKSTKTIMSTKGGASVKLTVVRDGTNFTLYIDDKYVDVISATGFATDFSGEMAAGFFSGGCTALFGNYSFTTDSSAINSYVSAHKG